MTESINQTRSTANAVDSSREKLDMQGIAHHVWRLNSNPPNIFNTYLIEDVLIDASTRWAAPRLLNQLASVPLSLVALTHCHPDHQGAARQICETRHIPLACHEADIAAMEGRTPMLPRNLLTRVIEFMAGGPAYPVQRILHDGDEIAGFRVIHTPGHTPGHVIYFRESDRVAIVGDVSRSLNPFTGIVGLGEMPGVLTVDREESRRSIGKLAQLRPALICFGHGPVLRDIEQFDRFVAQLPS
jgi:hydroxyacylglutathione hydrolase